MSALLAGLAVPLVQAPMAGGPSTPALAAAVSEAGGLGMLATGYLDVARVRQDLAEVRRLTRRPVGVNVFVPGPAGRAEDVARYAAALQPEADRHGVALGAPRHDDDAWQDKVALLAEERVPAVSFTFGLPEPGMVRALQAAGAEVHVTVTTAEEAVQARDAGADALVVQGVEAGGHRGGLTDEDGTGELGLLALLRLVADAVDLPLVATGGLMDGRGVAAALLAGATAAQLGTAFLLCPEAGTSAVHRQALREDRGTALTRAFTGRRARGLVTRLLREQSGRAPAAYPEVHHLTAPLRAAARAAGDPEVVNLWAGQGYPLARELPAVELVRQVAAEATEALGRAPR